MGIVAVTDNLWVARQPLRFLGLEIGTRMTVVRLSDGELVLISPIMLEEPDRQDLNNLGIVRHIVAPNLFHHLYVKQLQTKYPRAVTWGVDGLANKCPELKIDKLVNQAGSFGNDLDYWPFQGFASILPQGIAFANETVFFHRSSRTLIVTDTAFNFDQTYSLSTRLALRALGSYNSLRPTRLEKWGTRDKEAVADSVRRVLAWDFDRVIPAHGSIVETGGKDAFKAGYEWFLGCTLQP
ncbi:MAG: DUF4336 domain-containing protein [Cyanobacteria bacterium P01_H01_bin.21]